MPRPGRRAEIRRGTAALLAVGVIAGIAAAAALALLVEHEGVPLVAPVEIRVQRAQNAERRPPELDRSREARKERSRPHRREQRGPLGFAPPPADARAPGPQAAAPPFAPPPRPAGPGPAPHRPAPAARAPSTSSPPPQSGPVDESDPPPEDEPETRVDEDEEERVFE